jgi:SpoVK/Ycf46/Vps4 family AAA+-type ATPase
MQQQYNIDSSILNPVFFDSLEDLQNDHMVIDGQIDYQALLGNIKDLDDLLSLINLGMNDERFRCNLDFSRLIALREPLTELRNLIGMSEVKRQIIYQVLFYSQHLHETHNDMLHTVIKGAPGCGKTTLAKIIGQIYLKLGILKTDKFVVAKRADLIGKYLGHTAVQTQKVLESALGGVIFIDETYSLGNKEQRDSFSKECIDTINQFLSERKGEIVCIIAGYEKDLKECFFAYNQGLERRFPWVYTIPKYNAKEIRQIFMKQVYDDEWSFWNPNGPPLDFFQQNLEYFPYCGGDTETLYYKCKLVHGKRVFSLTWDHKKKLTMEDIQDAFDIFKTSNQLADERKHWESIRHMYT